MAQRIFRGTAVGLMCVASLSIGACASHESMPPEPDAPSDEVILQAAPPPPVDGGTLLVTWSDERAVAADADRDRIWVIDTGLSNLADPSLLHEIVLEPGDLPGRLVEDGAGLIHVVLRGAGQIATVDIEAGEILDRRAVCAAPRGIDVDDFAGTLLVACEDGQLVTLPKNGGAPSRVLRLDPDLRDVVVDGDRVLVSRFRSAEVLVLDLNGNVTSRIRPEINEKRNPNVAWRMTKMPGGGAVVMYQMSLVTDVETDEPGGYGRNMGDGPILMPGIAVLPPASSGEAKLIPANGPDDGALPVDIAVSPDASQIAIPSAGSSLVWQIPGIGRTGTLRRAKCAFLDGSDAADGVGDCQPVAVAYDSTGRLIVQSREPAMVMGVMLPAESRRDTGHDLFHRSPNGIVACASCHPGGLDDGHIWRIEDDNEPRRTPPLVGGISGTAPFHWKGDLPKLGDLMSLVFVNRMGGAPQDDEHIAALARWMDSLPALPSHAPLDEEAATRGKELFESPDVGCAVCHTGPQLTNNLTIDVGTGGPFQVPRLLGLESRAPYMHDGCAQTLFDRFSPACGGGDQHGHTSHLDEAQIADLVAYLNTL